MLTNKSIDEMSHLEYLEYRVRQMLDDIEAHKRYIESRAPASTKNASLALLRTQCDIIANTRKHLRDYT